MEIKLNEDFDFGFTTVREENLPSSNKAEKMYSMIMPLLKNLLQNAEESEYIHWPNRKEKIEEFIKKLTEVKES